MIKLQLQSKYTLSALLVIVVILFVGFVAVSNIKNLWEDNTDVKVAIKDFPEGTRIDYKLLSNGSEIDRGSKVIGKDKLLGLSVPDKIIKENNNILSYKLSLSVPDDEEKKPAKTLNLLLGLDRNNGNVSISGSGLEGFSDLIIRKNDRLEKITTDWAGLFLFKSSNDDYKSKQDSNEQIELAFQNYGLDSDYNPFGSGRIEVQYGDPYGSSKAAVNARYNQALRRMTEELSAVMVLQTEAIGMFFDASIQMDTQRKQQELMARAHKDYHPSEQMCRIGTFIRSVAHSESKAEVNKHALNKILMNQYLSTPNNSAGHGSQVNSAAEIDTYTKYFCDPRDNDGATQALCPFSTTSSPTADELGRLNKDIDYTRTLMSKLTLDVDFVDGSVTGTAQNDLEGDERDIIALAKNLYFPNVFEIPDRENLERSLMPHYSSRSFAAKMNVAHSSFLNIVGMKSKAPAGQNTVATTTSPPPATFGTGVPREEGSGLQSPLITSRPSPTVLSEDSGWAYMKALLREFGITDENGSGDIDDEIENILGERPSYYAQMEVLTKKIYQHPNFYTNLYDKPANVDRIGASIDAISLMHQRDRFESILRREMLTSLLIEEELSTHVEKVNSTIFEQMRNPQYE